MKVKPLVAVVGRPNVGKSTFFNKVCGKRISIVKDTPGVTRDRIFADAEWCGYEFTLIDTGGIQLKSDDSMSGNIRRQAQEAILSADVIIFMTDAKTGVTSDDYDVADILRQTNKPVVLAVNKLDNFDVEQTYDFYRLGIGEPNPISCEQSKGLGDLLDEVIKHFGEREEYEKYDGLNIALVGKPNVGKSSLVNRILGFERVIVSDVAGTTRDSIDTPFVIGDKRFNLIDTAGMRRKRSIDDGTVESYSVLRTLSAVRRADVVLTVIDASDEISEQDIKVAGFVHDEGKPQIIVLNKWDAVEKDTYTAEKYVEKLNSDLAFMSYYRHAFVSAKTGQRIEKLLDMALEVYQNASKRITTGTLNDVISEAVAMNEPPTHNGRRLKITYSTQASTNPPTFVIFVNSVELVHFSYKRYLENSLRKAFDFSGTPIKLVFNNKKGE